MSEKKYLDLDGVKHLVDTVKEKLNGKQDAGDYQPAGNYATLDSEGKVPAAQLPSYVDDVLEYASKTAFPAKGETGKIYVALDSNLTYRWSGTAYVEISPSIALGETSSTAYAGDKGAQNAKDIAAIKSGDLPLVSPQIVAETGNSCWSVETAEGEEVQGSWLLGNLNTIYGYTVNFNGCMKWTHADSYKDPTAMNGGDWSGAALPASGALSEARSIEGIKADRTITASVKAPKQGLIVDANGIIKEASGSDFDTKSASVKVHFQYKTVAGCVTGAVTKASLESMLKAKSKGGNYLLQDGKNKVLTGVTTAETENYVYAYPAKLGNLTKITMNDATPLIDGGFELTKVTVTDPETTLELEYNVYTSVQKGAFTNAKLDIA